MADNTIALTINHIARTAAWSGGQGNGLVNRAQGGSGGWFASTFMPLSKALNPNCFSKHGATKMDDTPRKAAAAQPLTSVGTGQGKDKNTTKDARAINTIKLYYICS